MAADLERSKVACRVRLILWLPLFLINGWEIEIQEWEKKSILSSSFLCLFIDAGIRYSCCEIHLLAFSPLLWCTLQLPPFISLFSFRPYTFISLLCSGSFTLHSLAGRDFNEALVFQIFSLLSPQAFPHNNNNKNNNNSEAISLNSCGTFKCGTLTARKLV